MRYRAYFKAPDGAEASAEFEAHGEVVRICDDHGRIVWDKTYSVPEIRKAITEIAAELVRCERTPSSFREDWQYLPPSMTKKGWAEIYRAAITIQDACKNWGYRLGKLAKALA